jgi:membrane-bound serine protease (ClpP class)
MHLPDTLDAAPSFVLRRRLPQHGIPTSSHPQSAGKLVAAALTAAFACLALLQSMVGGQTPSVSAQALIPAPAPSEQHAVPEVLVARLDGVIDPAEATYVQRVIDLAVARHAQAVALELEVRGGLDASVTRLQQALSQAPVPVITYVADAGVVDAAAQRVAAASALRGAPPGGESTPGTLPDVVSSSVIGFVRSADGRTVQVALGPVTLTTAEAPINSVDMEPLEMAAHRLFDPTTAYLLFVLGLFAVFVEVSHPGALVPGLTGLVSLILAVAAFAVLPVNLFGAALILLAVALMAVDARAIGHGGPTLIGIGCLVIGSLLLYAQWGGGSPLLPDLAIAPPALVVVTVAGLLLGFGLIRAAGSVRRLPPLYGTGQLIGAWGTSNGPLEPDGVVRVNGQLWSARLRDGQLGPDQPVRVRARHGLILDVEPATSRGAATEKGASR